jgi:adenylate cyclase
MQDSHLKHKLAAVLLADVVGYSRLMSVDEEGTHAQVITHVKNVIEPKVVENHGRLIRTMGDGFLVGFESAIDAVRCAVEIQRELSDHNIGIAATSVYNSGSASTPVMLLLMIAICMVTMSISQLG